MLKVRVDDTIVFFDGETPTDYLYRIKHIEKKEIVFEFVYGIQKNKFSRSITLFQALPNKYNKMEYILQK